MSFSIQPPSNGRDSPLIFAPNLESEEWLQQWSAILAKDLIDSEVVTVGGETTVEEACEILLSKDVSCLGIKSGNDERLLGLFDFSDVNAFLTLAATQHNLPPEVLRDNSQVKRIVEAAKVGTVSVEIVSNLSEKNPLKLLPDTATAVELLEVFSRGGHRVVIQSSTSLLGIVTDRSLLAHLHIQAKSSTALFHFLSNQLHSLYLPSLNLRSAVVCRPSSDQVLDAMQAMSQEGVSSVAIVDDVNAAGCPSALLSAVSVTDVGKMVVPSQDKTILTISLQQFVTQIKEPYGSTDGVDRYPVYSVSAASTLRFTMEKILATNAHRVFVTENGKDMEAPIIRGVVSIVDVLSLFARLANLPDVDPTMMQRHRRASSASSRSGSISRSPIELR